MGACLGKPADPISIQESNRKENGVQQRITSSYSSPGLSDSKLGQPIADEDSAASIDQIVRNQMNPPFQKPKNHSYPNTPKSSSNNLIAHPNSIMSSPNEVTLSFSNCSSPLTSTINSKTNSQNTARHSLAETSIDNYLKKLRQFPESLNPPNSAYLTSVMGPENIQTFYNIETDVFVALFDYNARDEEEISIRKADYLKVIDDS